MPEIEAKFLLRQPHDPERVLRALEGYGCRVQPLRRGWVRDRYFDTSDWRCRRAGWACRLRRQDGERELTLKSLQPARGPVFHREEVSQAVGADWRPGQGLPAGPLDDALGDALRGARLREIFRLRTDRDRYDVVLPGESAALVEMSIDRCAVRVRRRHERLSFVELELELKRGAVAALEALARRLGEDLALSGARLSKYERGLQVAGIEPLSIAAAAGEPLDRDTPLSALARASVALNLARLESHEPRAAEGLHPEGVHQMRVATRRLRALLKAFRDCLPDEGRARASELLRELARVLGDVRDADVYAEHFRAWCAALPDEDRRALENYRLHLEQVGSEARARLDGYLHGERYAALLDVLRGLAADGAAADRRPACADTTIERGATTLLRGTIGQMLDAGRTIDAAAPEDELHALRILGKRARYQAEFFREVYPEELDRFLKACRRLQDVLGEHHDAVVACQRLRRYAASVPVREGMRRELLALGRLIQMQSLHGAEQRRRFPKHWKRFARAAKRATP